MEEHQKNALIVGKWLEKHPSVISVRHPGLPSHPQHELVKRQCYGHSGMMSFYIKGGLEESKNLEAEERARLEDEINTKKTEVDDIVAEVKRKEDENRQLQEEMDDARKRQEEASQALIAATTTPKHHHLQVRVLSFWTSWWSSVRLLLFLQ